MADRPAKKPQRTKRNAQPKRPTDVAILNGPTDDGEGAKVLRFREDSVSAGEVRPMREGAPLNDRELVRLRPLGPQGVCEVEVVHDGQSEAGQPGSAGRNKALSSGPAQVATDAYRKNWSQVFRPRKRKKTPRDFSIN